MLFSIQQLCARAGLKPRTVRSYIQAGILERPTHGGAKTMYDEATVLRASLAVRLLRQGKTLEEARRALAKMNEAQLRAALAPPVAAATAARPPAEAVAAAPSSARLKAAGARSALRLALLPGLELVVDEDAPEVVKRLALELTRDFRARVVSEG